MLPAGISTNEYFSMILDDCYSKLDDESHLVREKALKILSENMASFSGDKGIEKKIYYYSNFFQFQQVQN